MDVFLQEEYIRSHPVPMIRTKQEFERFLQASVAVEHLTLRPLEPLPSSALFLIAAKCPSLRAFSWINNRCSEEQWLEFARRSSQLQFLNLSGSAHVTGRVVNELVGNGALLRCLDLSFCPLDDSAFAAVTTPLSFLNLQGCSALTDATLHQLSKLPTLRHLLVAFNDQITPAGLQAFTEGRLKTLKIHGCRNIESLVA